MNACRPPRQEGNRYSVYCITHGCLESRASGLKEARRILRGHDGCGCNAGTAIYHWHVNDETKAHRKAARLVS